MASPPWEDLSEFFDPDEFATSARILRGEELIGEVLGIYEDPTTPKDLGDFTLSEDGPRFTSPENGALAAKTKDIIEIDGKQYDVMAPARKDGSGLVIIDLAEPATAHVAL